MSTGKVITAKGVSKKFCRSSKRAMLYGMRDVACDLLGGSKHLNKLRRDEFWAVDEVSFEIARGECVGLIGSNGAGKSTLLKLLSGVTLPDKGALQIRGRVGALLELGAGFHPMLTGRENVYLSGAILGLSQQEVDERIDAIVDFAGLEEFVDTPVKQYSTGMYVRLGFAVAVSTDPDILIIDEAIAVGDAVFRTRCLEKMDAFIQSGKTMIVVSHNLQEIERIAKRVILLDHGRVQMDGRADQAIAAYFNLLNARQQRTSPVQPEGGDSAIDIVEVAVCDREGMPKSFFRTHEEMAVVISFRAHRPMLNPVFRVQIYRSDGLFCHGMNTERHGIDSGAVSGDGRVTLHFRQLSLLGGDYSVHVAVLHSQYDEVPLHQFASPVKIHVESKMADGAGVFAMPSKWMIKPS